MRTLLISVACLVCACQTPPPAAPAGPQPPFTLVDLTDDYIAFYDRTAGMETNARVVAFKAAFAEVFPGFYDTARISSMFGAPPEQYDGMIARSFGNFPELRPHFETMAASFEAMLAPARVDFVRYFPDLAPIGDVYLVHSVGEMDGGTRSISGRRVFVFGADMMAQLYAPGAERPFFQHELFHIYHGQFFQSCDEVWCGLWREGLAVYVSEQLNPGATDGQMGLMLPRPIRPEVDANLPAAICAVRARFSSDDRADYVPLFLGQSSLDGLPPRFGYYVGYLVAREAARTHSLQDLAHLTKQQARAVVEEAISALATCPAAN